MDRRDFLSAGSGEAGLTASTGLVVSSAKAETKTIGADPILKRKLGKTGEELSIVGLGGMVLVDNSPSFASNIVAEMILDMDSTEVPLHAEQEQSCYNGYFESTCFHPMASRRTMDFSNRGGRAGEVSEESRENGSFGLWDSSEMSN